MINDGRIALEVVKHVSNSTLECQTITAGAVENRKGVNFPGVALDVPSLTEQDEQDLELALKNGAADFLFLISNTIPSAPKILHAMVKSVQKKCIQKQNLCKDNKYIWCI